jgi:NAD(P)H-hydrate repair Nnr-like enzyme with NAD(P)H-hydrate epimerase domain
MAEISNDESSAPIFARAQAGFSQAIDGIFGMLSPSALRWSAAALVALLVGQAIVIGVLLGPGGNGPDQYRTATGQEGPVTTGTYVLVRFNDTATAQQINQFLDQENAVIVDGPKPGGLYKIRISESNFSQQELKERLEKILSYRGTIGRVFQTE